MKLKKEFIGTEFGREFVLVPTGNAAFHGVIQGNKTLGVIAEYLKEDTTEEAIVAAMSKRFDAPCEIIARDVRQAIYELDKVGALDN